MLVSANKRSGCTRHLFVIYSKMTKTDATLPSVNVVSLADSVWSKGGFSPDGLSPHRNLFSLRREGDKQTDRERRRRRERRKEENPE